MDSNLLAKSQKWTRNHVPIHFDSNQSQPCLKIQFFTLRPFSWERITLGWITNWDFFLPHFYSIKVQVIKNGIIFFTILWNFVFDTWSSKLVNFPTLNSPTHPRKLYSPLAIYSILYFTIFQNVFIDQQQYENWCNATRRILRTKKMCRANCLIDSPCIRSIIDFRT